MTPPLPQNQPQPIRLLPPFAALLFSLHLAIAALHPTLAVLDPGTGWHLKTGAYIVGTGSIPVQDLFSWTMPDQPWVAYQWLFQAILGWLQTLGGLPLATAFGVCVYAAIPVVVFANCRDEGASAPIALLSAAAAHQVLLMHAFLRPHMFTYLFFAFFAGRLRGFERHTRAWPRLAVLPPLMVLWTNLHPAFAVGLVVTGIFLAASALPAVIRRDRESIRKTAGFAIILAVCSAASLVNPRGWHLHASITGYLNLESLKWWLEFRSPNFQEDGHPIRVFGFLLLFSLLLLGRKDARLRGAEFILLPCFLHLALASRRHVNLFVILLAPALAREVENLIRHLLPKLGAELRRSETSPRRPRSAAAWIAVIAFTFLAWGSSSNTPFRRNLDGIHLSEAAARFIESRPSEFARMFNIDSLGGSLIYRFWPAQRVFMDDRTDLYLDPFITNTYASVFYLKTNWNETLEAWRVTAVVVPSRNSLVTLLQSSIHWTPAFADEQTSIFFPATAARTP